MKPKKAYAKPEVLNQQLHAFDEPQEEASPEDMAAAERLRPLYLLNERTDWTPIATRLTTSSGQYRADWQKVLRDPGHGQEFEPKAESELYFLCSMPHTDHFKIELQALCPDSKTRIVVANVVSIQSDKKFAVIVLSKKMRLASCAGGR